MATRRHFLRVLAIFMAVNFLATTFFPTISWALTSGPSQPEFTAYESIGATDIVNLITGDFTYNIPLVHVPGPEGGFSMPLSYHAGITPEQQASWVGLGWSLNPGAIGRTPNQFPDDFSAVQLHTERTHPGGGGHSVNFIVASYSYDSNRGEGGTVGLGSVFSVGFGSQEGVTAMGINYSGGKVTADPVGIATSVISVATLGATTPLAVGLNVASSFYSLGSAAMAVSAGNYSSAIGQWTFESNNYLLYQKWKYYLDVDRTDYMFGCLNLDKMLITGDGTYGIEMYAKKGNTGLECDPDAFIVQYMYGTASDMSMEVDGPLSWNINPTSIAYDGYSVMGEGITGSMSPYRYEIGSLAHPNLGGGHINKLKLIPFLDYKLSFRYNNDYSNLYTHHYFDQGDHFGLDYSECGPYNSSKIHLNDPRLHDENFRTEPEREGFYSNRLIKGKNVEWFKNYEIANNTATNSGLFIDFLSETEEGESPSRSDFRYSLNSTNGIGGFSVTREDGYTFHYALPVYNFNFNSKISNDDNSITERLHYEAPYAYSWLLTGVTGPDFVDRGEIGIIDNADWGYWVKLDYGKFSSNYRWQNPYYGSIKTAGDNNLKTFSAGTKETYYLDKIQTRTHTALFIKNLRNDGRSVYSVASSDSYPSSSLKLEEIIVLKNEDVEILESNLYNLRKNSPQTSTTDLSVKNDDTFSRIYDRFDFTQAIINYIDTRQIKKIKFNYNNNGDEYELCKGTLNSFPEAEAPPRVPDMWNYAIRGGKLTLQSVSVFGKNDVKLFPDFKFDYGNNNPDYRFEKWDGWGMYKIDGEDASWGHKTDHESMNDAAVWNLSKITTPLGGTVEVNYERDSYSSVAGEPVKYKFYVDNYLLDPETWRVYSSFSSDFDFTKIFKENQTIYIEPGESVIDETCEWRNSKLDYWRGPDKFRKTLITPQYTIGNITPNSFQILNPPDYVPTQDHDLLRDCQLVYISMKFIAEVTEVPGGDIRVSEIATSNGSDVLKSRYVYTEDGNPTSVSSGVVSREPEYIYHAEVPVPLFYGSPDWISTPVLYKKVFVYNGKLTNIDDFNSGTEYIFNTPDASMVHEDLYTHFEGSRLNSEDYRLKMYNMILNIHTSQIGRLESIRSFDKYNSQLEKTELIYSDKVDNGIGIFTEGSVLAENRWESQEGKGYLRIFRTTKFYHPNILVGTRQSKDGQSSKITYSNFDFYTAEPLQQDFTNSLGVKYRTRSVPAYTIDEYAGMRSKALDPTNRNMFAQKTAEYLYKVENEAGIDVEKEIFASVQTWDNNWKLRHFIANGTEPRNGFIYSPIVEDPSTPGPETVWRPKGNYVWNSALLNQDGSLANFVNFNWGSSTGGGKWQKVSEVSGYNEYSVPFDMKDVNNHYAAIRTDVNKDKVIAKVSLSNHVSSTYSGFENNINTTGGWWHFDGEMYHGQNQIGTVGNIKPHTGSHMLRVDGYTHGYFARTYNGGEDELIRGRKYRASVWMHADSDESTRMTVHLTGSLDGQSFNLQKVTWKANAIFTAGKWKLVVVDFEVPHNYLSSGYGDGSTHNDLRIFFGSAPGTVGYIDDFRLHPIESSMTSYVYDEQTGQLTHVIDENNLYTRYEYNDRGQLVATYRETKKGEVKVAEYQQNYSRQAEID